MGRVLRSQNQSFGLVDAGIALNCVQRQVQPTGDLEQPAATIEQIMNLLPAFAGRGGAFALAGWRAGLAPARAVGGDLFEHGLGGVVSQVPAIRDLHRVGQCAADRFGAGAGAIALAFRDNAISMFDVLNDVGLAILHALEPRLGFADGY